MRVRGATVRRRKLKETQAVWATAVKVFRGMKRAAVTRKWLLPPVAKLQEGNKIDDIETAGIE